MANIYIGSGDPLLIMPILPTGTDCFNRVKRKPASSLVSRHRRFEENIERETKITVVSLLRQGIMPTSV